MLFLNAAGVCATSGRNGTLQKSTCNQPDCLRCDLETAECVKCLYVIMADTRECRSACPPGHATTWATHHALMGRVCTERSVLALVSGRDVTIIAGAAVGGAVCVGVVIGALLYMRRRTKPPPDNPRVDYRHHRYPIPRLWRDKRPKATEVSVADEERAEFLKQLATLRGEAGNFLEMLSETRNRFRRLGGPDSATDTRAKAYRAVVRDLSRVLTLLNRREEHIVTVPGDWRRLLSWAARVLARYKRQKAAKEAGDITALEPLATGTLYQTRRQAQAERCRLVAQGGQCSAPFQDPPTPRVTEVHPPAYRETTPCSQLSSRSASLMSLTHILEEEEEYEAADNHDDVLFSENEEQEHEDAKLTPSEKDDLTVADKSLEKQNSPDADYGVVNEKLLTESKFVKENNNNNITKNLSDLTNNIVNIENFRPPSNVSENINNLKNLEHLREMAPVLIQTKENIAQDQEKKHAFNNNDIQTKENIAPTHKAITDLQTLYKEKINTTLTGEDVYINVIRKPVVTGLLLGGDPYRDDTIESAEERAPRLHVPRSVPPRSCKIQMNRRLPPPKCELTTEL